MTCNIIFLLLVFFIDLRIQNPCAARQNYRNHIAASKNHIFGHRNYSMKMMDQARTKKRIKLKLENGIKSKVNTVVGKWVKQ